MPRIIDLFLDRITMYRLMLYVLIALVLSGALICSFGLLAFSPLALLFSAFFITTLCLVANMLFAWTLGVSANVESAYITALILALIISPPKSPHDLFYFSLATSASILAMLSKYLLAIGKKHLFNPAAIAVVITAFTINQSASWWIGTFGMLPFSIIGGLLIARKIRRFDMVIAFLFAAILVIGPTHLWTIVAYTPLIFFATVMLTEPLTTPPARWLRIGYAVLVGVLFSPVIHIGGVYSTPELALIVGNLFSYIVSPKERLILKLKERHRVARDTYDFIFATDRKMKFTPGEYMEWTLPDANADSRGNRRYFTIASSPTEKDIVVGVKYYPEPSSFKRKLLSLEVGDTIVASQRAGDFTLPAHPEKKLAFIAGGIGVTPFRSMLKYLIDKKEKRDIVVFYANKTVADIAYNDILEAARSQLGIKVVHSLTDVKAAPIDWRGSVGRLDPKIIAKAAPDFAERTFYLSGPHSMIVAFEETLGQMNVKKNRIKKDYFPGFA